MKKLIFFFKSEKFTSPANEFLLHKCRNNRKIKKMIFFSNLKNVTSPASEFLLDRIVWKNAQVLLMSFFYKGIAKKCTSPSNEFLLHACGQTDSGTAGQTDKRTYIYPPLDKRYSPIISTICGPNNMYKKKLRITNLRIKLNHKFSSARLQKNNNKLRWHN